MNYDNIKKSLDKIFGVPNKGIHSYRLFNIAYIDVIFTILGAYLIKIIFFKKTNYLKVLLGFFILGIILHRFFQVRTTIDKLLFPNK
jgi:hypothetical protein